MKLAVDPFELFCLYYLGLSPEGDYRFVNGNQIAKRYNTTVDAVLHHLRSHDLDPDTVLNTDFPMARYQIDVQLAAESEHGPDALELASRIFEAYHSSRGRRRDWQAEIEEERDEDRRRRRDH